MEGDEGFGDVRVIERTGCDGDLSIDVWYIEREVYKREGRSAAGGY